MRDKDGEAEKKFVDALTGQGNAAAGVERLLAITARVCNREVRPSPAKNGDTLRRNFRVRCGKAKGEIEGRCDHAMQRQNAIGHTLPSAAMGKGRPVRPDLAAERKIAGQKLKA